MLDVYDAHDKHHKHPGLPGGNQKTTCIAQKNKTSPTSPRGRRRNNATYLLRSRRARPKRGLELPLKLVLVLLRPLELLARVSTVPKLFPPFPFAGSPFNLHA